MKLSPSFLIISGTLNNKLIVLFYYYMVTTNNTQVTLMLTRIFCPFSLQTLTATSTFLSVDLLPLENSPQTRVRYRSLRTSPGRITSGKPIFRANVTLPNTKCGFSSRTCKKVNYSQLMPIRMLTFWLRTFFQILTHPVFKM